MGLNLDMRLLVRRLAGAIVLALPGFYAIYLVEGLRLTVGILVAVPSLALLLLARRQLGSSFAVMPEAKGLVTQGLYSRIQHPLYFFLDLILVGLIIIFAMPVLLMAWGVLVIIHTLQARREEKVLAAAYGDEYKAYQKRTWF
jgi:protein-S-isoprenylcysteine O-methyltransferase Ste14